MRERRLCLWTASRSSPFRLDLEEAYLNKSWSLEMLVPLFWGNSTAILEPCLARIQTGIVAVIANLMG